MRKRPCLLFVFIVLVICVIYYCVICMAVPLNKSISMEMLVY